MTIQTLKIVAVGDLSFNGRYHRLLDRHGPQYPLRQVLPHWGDADLRLGNLESPLTARPKVSPAKCTLRGAPRAIDTLQHARFDFVSVANNHMMDFGPDGLAETCDKLDAAGIAYAGAGNHRRAACSPAVLTRNGLAIGLLAYCDVDQDSALYADERSPGVAPARLDSCLRQICELRPHVDWLIIQLHWGQEMAQLPSPQQRDWARRFADAGADLVLGHHPHVLQPLEIINGMPVLYSLGDFIFSDMFWRGRHTNGDGFVARMPLHPLSRRTGWAEILLHKQAAPEIQFRPAILTRGLTVTPDNSVKRREEWETLNAQMHGDDYARIYEADDRRAGQRLDSLGNWRSLTTRLELKLFQCGLIPNAAEGT